MFKFGALSAVICAASIFAYAPASAITITADTGWQADNLDAPGVPSENSPYTFTVSKSSVFSLSDCCVAGDTYTLSGDLSATSSFFAGKPTDIQASGDYGSYWTDASYSKIALNVGPGTYDFSITGDGSGGTPAGFGVRLDTATSSVPESATWLMMILGFGTIGGVMRSAHRKSEEKFTRKVRSLATA